MTRNFDNTDCTRARKELFKRDQFNCQWPHCALQGTLHEHDIQTMAHNPGFRFLPVNGINLCREPHDLIHGHDKRYVSFIFKIK